MFYKKKYLIAIYNEQDQCIGVFDNVKEFTDFYQLNIAHIYTRISRMKGLDWSIRIFKTFYLRVIEVESVNEDDVFELEDRIFKNLFEKQIETNKKYCKLNKLCESSFYSKRKVMREKVSNEL